MRRTTYAPAPVGARVGEHVVLADGSGRPAGTVPKAAAHSHHTPLHFAFSCHAVRRDGSVLLTRRAGTKATWPLVWTNACCGHPQAGETLRAAVCRRLDQELGLRPVRLAVVLPDFAYRATMPDGTVEHELCPVVVAEVDGTPSPDPAEVDAFEWLPWAELADRASTAPATLSPWSVAQVAELLAAGWAPPRWLAAPATPAVAALLDAVPGRAATPAWAPDRAAQGAALAPIGGPVDALLDAFLAEKACELDAVDAAIGEVVGVVRGLVAAGGKRLRPAFVHWGHAATGAAPGPGVVRAAAAVELLHTFALLHDDVMDRSARRRGRDTAHVALAARHRDAGRLGDSAWFGTSAAVLAGDLAYVWADELLDGTAMPAAAVDRARRVFTTLRNEVIAGQYLDLVLAADPDAGEHAATRVALLKSARYTVTRPLELGAALGDVDGAGRVSGALRAYGDAVGLAFQLRDDVLGLFGDPAATGKSAADDLREGKRTLLVLRALRLADRRQRAVLAAALGDPLLDDARADEARTVVAATGALASVEALLAAEHAKALDAADGVPEPARSALRALAALAIRRRR